MIHCGSLAARSTESAVTDRMAAIIPRAGGAVNFPEFPPCEDMQYWSVS